MTLIREKKYKPDETRERILGAALALCQSRGYADTSTLDIAKEAGVSEGSIFYHFGNKSNLFAALGARFGARVVAAMRGDAEDLAELEPGIMIMRCFDLAGEEGLIIQQLGLPSTSPDTEAFMRADRDVVVDFIEAVLRAHQALGRLDDIDIPLAASLGYAAVCDALMRTFNNQEPVDRGRILAETIRFVRAAFGYTPSEATPASEDKTDVR